MESYKIYLSKEERVVFVRTSASRSPQILLRRRPPSRSRDKRHPGANSDHAATSGGRWERQQGRKERPGRSVPEPSPERVDHLQAGRRHPVLLLLLPLGRGGGERWSWMFWCWINGCCVKLQSGNKVQATRLPLSVFGDAELPLGSDFVAFMFLFFHFHRLSISSGEVDLSAGSP